jgi:hypothetical protein
LLKPNFWSMHVHMTWSIPRSFHLSWTHNSRARGLGGMRRRLLCCCQPGRHAHKHTVVTRGPFGLFKSLVCSIQIDI